MEIDFLQNTFMLYIVGSMLVSWIALINSRGYRTLSPINRFKEALFCCAITGAITVPLVDYFTTIPSSISLIIGALVGILGYNGFVNLFEKVLELVFNLIPTSLSGVFHVPTYRRFGKPPAEEDGGEEPPPIRRRSDNARK